MNSIGGAQRPGLHRADARETGKSEEWCGKPARASRSAAFPVAGRDGRRRVHRQAKGGCASSGRLDDGHAASFGIVRAHTWPCPQEDRTGHGCVVTRFKLARRAGGKSERAQPSWVPTALAQAAGGCRFQGPTAVWSEVQPADTSAAEPFEGPQRRDGSRRSQLHDGRDGGIAHG